jgi:hypothetical protein
VDFVHRVYFYVLCDFSLSSKCSPMQHELVGFCIINCGLFLYGIRIPVLDVLYDVKTELKGMPRVDNTSGLRSPLSFTVIKNSIGLFMKFRIWFLYKKISRRILFVKIGSMTFKLYSRVEISFCLHVSYFLTDFGEFSKGNIYLMPLKNPEFHEN